MSTRARLTAKHPRPTTPERAPVRRGTTTARKPVRPAAPAAPAPRGAKPAGAQGTARSSERTGAKSMAARAPQGDRPARPASTKPYGKPGAAAGDRARPAGTRSPRPGDDRTGERRRPAPGRDGEAPRQARTWARDDDRPARAPRKSYGDDSRPARPRPAGADDERRPPRSRAEGGRDERRPPRERTPSGDDRRPAHARTAGYDGERRPARPRAEGYGDERRPARPRSEDADDRKRPYADRKTTGTGPRKEFGKTDDRRSRYEGDRGDRGERSDTRPGRRPAGEERNYARPAKATYGDRDAAPARRRTADAPGGDASRPRSPRKTDDAPARKIGTRVKPDTRAHEPVSAEPAPRRHEDDAAGSLRLSKRMSELGLCSRREADEWIEKGWVFVDGERIDTLGSKVTPDQRIEIDPAARAAQARQVTILLHKPVGYVSGQAEDGYAPAATLVTAENQWEGDRSGLRFSPLHLRTLAPAGRLDIDSTGLLVLTQDGRVAKQLIGEQSDIDKEYLVRVTYGEHETEVDQQFPAELLAKLRHGLSLDDVPLKPAMVSWQNGEQLRFILREGKKRQIRRMCELVGLKVVGLKRVRMGRVLLGALPQGQWRYLTPDESF
ncbi:pseudouridine synthase [Paraburkholderia sp. J12]|uniref:pseudouridine synthase n=1 Tax=Paraburkholderia sp. J12 TaxID=2805432 RepID=UPI002ABDD6A2|nr:pseudouridine synthase [Paraburkholderia sp. J12]